MKDPTLAGTRLDQYFHVCSFFNSRDEEYDVLTPFYREAFEGGETCFISLRHRIKTII